MSSKLLRSFLFLSMVLVSNSPLSSQSKQQVFTSTDATLTRPFQYLIWFPEGYTASRKAPWSVVFFFHGSGERGIDPQMVAKNGPPRRIEDGIRYPVVVISPQCSGYWWDSDDLERFLEEMIVRWNLSRSDVRLTGLSMGGYAVWNLAVRHPERYFRILPICGAGDPKLAPLLVNLGVWAIHGALDQVVPVRGTTAMIEALERAGGRPKMTIYPDLDHDSWTRAYSDPEVEAWLFGG